MVFQRAYKNMWSPSGKVKVAIFQSFFRWFGTNIEKSISTKNKAFYIMFGTFIRNSS
jgi:hypothetical protein